MLPTVWLLISGFPKCYHAQFYNMLSIANYCLLGLYLVHNLSIYTKTDQTLCPTCCNCDKLITDPTVLHPGPGGGWETIENKKKKSGQTSGRGQWAPQTSSSNAPPNTTCQAWMAMDLHILQETIRLLNLNGNVHLWEHVRSQILHFEAISAPQLLVDVILDFHLFWDVPIWKERKTSHMKCRYDSDGEGQLFLM